MSGPGLPALNESRKERRRRLTSGRAVIGGIPPKLFLSGLLVLIVGGFLYFRAAQAELDQQRGRIMAKQRAVALELAPRLIPMRDHIEAGVSQLAETNSPKTFVADGVDFEQLFSSPGMYLRIRLEDARDLTRTRKAAMESLRDGVAACLIRDERAASPARGRPCKESHECAAGELCSEYGACGRPSSPFNARLLYRALGVLSEQWTSEVREAGTELALLAYERGLDSVTTVDIPVAIDVYQRAKYALVVLDETPPGGLPPHVDADKLETEMQRLQRTAHAARVGVWSLPDGKLLAQLTGSASGALRDVGQRVARSAETDAARSRQANSCALALDIRAQLLATTAGPKASAPLEGDTAPRDDGAAPKAQPSFP